MSATRLTWHGDKVYQKVIEASKRGIDDTMADAVNTAKSNHPGWKNRTGQAEGSIAIQRPAREEGGSVVGRWGSQGVNYFIILETMRGAALRHAADVTYGQLGERIKRHYR